MTSGYELAIADRVKKAARMSCAAGLGALIAVSLARPALAAEEAWPSQLEAVYKISFNGFNIGSFRFNSQMNGKAYTLDASAEISALLGAFKWRGTTRSQGTVASSPKPANYNFDYRSNSKTGGVRMSFAQGNVSKVQLIPEKTPSKENVPVLDHHLKDVLDPLTAVMAMSQGGSANPCGRKISIFDGKQRFDLVLSFRRQQKITEAKPSGQPGIAYVCRVKYVPIAGHKMNEETKSMASGNIEIALRPIPSANILVPYQVTIPTMAGPATLTSQRIDITSATAGQIALVH